MLNIKDYIKRENEYSNFTWAEDVKRIVKALDDRGVYITPSDAEMLWISYSDDFCACWLGLPSDDNELFEIIINKAKDFLGDEEE